MIKIYFLKEIMEENKSNQTFYQILELKMNKYLNIYEGFTKKMSGFLDIEEGDDAEKTGEIVQESKNNKAY